MSEHPYKAEYMVWLDAPDVWVWQIEYSGRWSYVGRSLPGPCEKFKWRLVPRAWLDDPDSVEVWAQAIITGSFPAKWVLKENPTWDHSAWRFDIRPRTRTRLYQARVEVPEQDDNGKWVISVNLSGPRLEDTAAFRLDDPGFIETYATQADAEARIAAMLTTERG